MRRALAFACALALLAGLGLAAGALYRAGWIRFNYPDPQQHPVWGVDVSHHQAEVDWRALRRQGVEFAFIKATEGATHRDTRFEANWAAAGDAGIARGAYHFFTFCAPGAAQAENFLRAVRALDPELPPVADVEFAGNCRSWESIGAIRAELAAFLAGVEAGLARRPILYYTREAAERILAGHFHEHPRWARSVFGAPDDELLGPWSWWQYADNARLPGVRGPVDLNVFRGGREEFGALRGAAADR
jgi:lysozyme